MKRFFALIIAFIMLTACAEERPREYEFYNGFTRPPELEIPATDISGYKDTTSAENSLLVSELQLEQLADHKLYEKKKAVVVQFYFHIWQTEFLLRHRHTSTEERALAASWVM